MSEAKRSRMRVLISGAGVAGMACGALLDPEKYDVSIIEQAAGFRNLGFSIVLWKSGYTLLTELLRDRDIDIVEGKDAYVVDGFKLFGGSKMKLLRQFDSRGFSHAFRRQRLMEVLEEAVKKRVPENRIRFSRSIKHVQYEHAGGPALVTYRDGEQERYDVLIIAEGMHSSTRECVALEESITSDQYALRYAWFSTPTELGPYAALFFSEGQIAIVHPPDTENLLGFYFDKGTPESAQRDFEKKVESRIKQPNGEDSRLDLKTSDVFELKEVHLKHYSAGNVAAIGDAAHGRPPTLGFGTTLALEDATTLARILNTLDNPSALEIERALSLYSRARIPRVEEIYRMQHRIQLFYKKNHCVSEVMAFLVEAFLGIYFEIRVRQLAAFEVPHYDLP